MQKERNENPSTWTSISKSSFQEIYRNLMNILFETFMQKINKFEYYAFAVPPTQ